MKTILTIIAVFTTILFFESCSTDDMENSTPQVENAANPYNDAMMQRDTLSREDAAIDPPGIPPIKP